MAELHAAVNGPFDAASGVIRDRRLGSPTARVAAYKPPFLPRAANGLADCLLAYKTGEPSCCVGGWPLTVLHVALYE